MPRQVARAIGTDHHEVVVGMDDFFDALPKLIWHEDEPIAWPSSVSLYFVSKLAAAAGEGGADGRRQRRVVRRLRALSLESARTSAGRGAYRQCARTAAPLDSRASRDVTAADASTAPQAAPHVRSAATTAWNRCSSTISIARFREEQNGCWPHARGVYGNYMRYWNARRKLSPLARMLYADQKTYLVELLMKQDQMSMAASIESRVPFLDHPFVEFADAHSGSAQDPRAHTEVHSQESRRGSASARYRLPQEDGFPDAAAAWLLRPARRAALRRAAVARRIAGSSSRSARSGRADRAPSLRPRRRHRSHLAAAESPALGRSVYHRPARAVVEWRGQARRGSIGKQPRPSLSECPNRFLFSICALNTTN